jgi:hypothetical protein
MGRDIQRLSAMQQRDDLSEFFKYRPKYAAQFIRLTLLNRLITNYVKLLKIACHFSDNFNK